MRMMMIYKTNSKNELILLVIQQILNVVYTKVSKVGILGNYPHPNG